MRPAGEAVERAALTWRVVLLRCVAIVFLVLAGAALRLYDVNWDQFQHVHPDERFIVWVADTIAWPGSLAAALDPQRSTINPLRWPPADSPASKDDSLAGKPRNYAYGHFPLYLLVVVAHVGQRIATWFEETTLAFPAWLQPVHTVGRHLASYNYLPLVGRVISALADVGTLILVYFLARSLVRDRAFGFRVEQPIAQFIPLLAVAAYTFAVLPIQLSHFATVDALLTFFVTATVALAVSVADRAARSTIFPWLLWLLAGAMSGLAVGSKFSAVLLALPLTVAALYGSSAGSLHRGTGDENARWTRAFSLFILRLAPAGTVAALVFALTNPFALIEFGAYVRQLAAQNAMVSGVMDAPYTRQYIGTLPYLYFVHQLSQWGLGWPL
ncbi:MAG: phospholipid carrier-dependent glycosyltransferase, partial [Anaerolineae bacterium]|nr:phospholipid carrier-dependent glycosyltransferase [Anaerolineae bacterium]